MLDLDQMREQWAEEGVRLNRQVLTAINLKAGEPQLTRLLNFTVVHAVAWFGCIVLLGNFIFEHIAEPRFVVAAAVLDVYAIGFLMALIRQVLMASRIDYGQPITVIQRQVEALRILRIRTTQWGVLVGTILCAPFLVVVSKAGFGMDVYHALGAAWMVTNLAFGFVLAALAIWISKKFAKRLKDSPLVQHVMNDLAGNNLNAAAAFLTALAQFEKV